MCGFRRAWGKDSGIPLRRFAFVADGLNSGVRSGNPSLPTARQRALLAATRFDPPLGSEHGGIAYNARKFRDMNTLRGEPLSPALLALALLPEGSPWKRVRAKSAKSAERMLEIIGDDPAGK